MQTLPKIEETLIAVIKTLPTEKQQALLEFAEFLQAKTNAGKAGTRELLHLDHGKELVRSSATEGNRQGHAQKTVSSGLVPDLPVHIAAILPIGMIRGDVLVHELRKCVAKLLMLGIQKCAFDHFVEGLDVNKRQRPAPASKALDPAADVPILACDFPSPLTLICTRSGRKGAP